MKTKMKTIGVLALQGAFVEHEQVLHACKVNSCEVRTPADLENVDGLIVPGGESTTFGKLAALYGLIEAIQTKARQGMPVWGTCAGMIFLAKDVGQEQPILGLMDIEVERNAFGRQLDSFEILLDITEVNTALGVEAKKKFPAVFIRAPIVTKTGSRVQALAKLEDGKIVAVRQGNLLATSFHPELTQDRRFHQYFLQMV